MWYSLIGFLAIIIQLIINSDLLYRRKNIRHPEEKDYRPFLLSIITYHATDALWGILYQYKLSFLLFLDTEIYFAVMALSVLLWTRYVLCYLRARNRFGKILYSTGITFFVCLLILLLANFFTPILFSISSNGEYHASLMRYVVFSFQIIMFFIISIYTFVNSCNTENQLKQRYRTIAFFGLAMILAISAQILYPLLPLYSIGCLLGCCVVHTFVLEEEKVEYDTIQREIAYTKERQRNLNAMRDAMMITIADLVESRDQNTGTHIRKTASYVNAIINELKRQGMFKDTITDEYIENVVRSAPLHDIGKINVPDSILNKPDKLTDEEFKIMMTHAAVGGKIIDHIIQITPDSEYLNDAKDLATYHHEKWNGAGYPEGLAGENIPLSARIMAVADVFDALVSNRAYKKKFPLEKAFAIIREESGTHFDPRIVNAFFAARSEIIRIEKEFENT
ncbi:MAG: HD domain-containing protein [Desulfovibrio sp.]|nr:HD domain-containing protein [Desulfovibrio sp.]